MAAIAVQSNEANLELGENNKDNDKVANSYAKSIILLVLFNVTCFGLFIFAYELFVWDENRAYKILKVAATFIGLIIIVTIGRMKDFSKGNHFFYYI